MAVPLVDYARAVPLNAIRAFGLDGSSVARAKKPVSALRGLRSSQPGVWNALDTAGHTGRRIVSVIAALGGVATSEEFAFQTRDADQDDLAEALERVVVAGLVERASDGSLRLAERIAGDGPSWVPSMADPHALNSDVLAVICRKGGVGQPIPTRKQERIDAIAALFRDPHEVARIRGELSASAVELLERIARFGGPGPLDSQVLGIEHFLLRHAAPTRYNRSPPRHLVDFDSLGALRELTHCGIVGVTEWGSEVWIWKEAWPVADRPFYTDWPDVKRPDVVTVADGAVRVPSIVATVGDVMQAWESNPPAVLKNGDPRVAKPQVRSTAKSIGSDETTVDLVGQLLIAIGLLLPNVISESGRGRNRRVEQSWLADPTLSSAWADTAPLERWVRLFAEWCRPSKDCGHQLLVNRHLLIWELGEVDDGEGYDDAERLAQWIAHRHGSLGHPDAVAECIAELRALGAVTADGAVGLTRLARAALDDPASISEVAANDATTAIVQADLTVVAPPDLRHDLSLRLASLGEVESDSGAIVYRLSPERITRAAQGGDTADGIVDFLAKLSSVPLTDTVDRLVRDAASRAGRVRVLSAATVVVVSDPVDLATACSVKAAKLTAVSDTVAVSEVAPAKVVTALDRKGLAPDSVYGGTDRPRRSSESDAREVAARAAGYRSRSDGPTSQYMSQAAERLESSARELADVSARLSVTGPLAVTPAIAERRFADKRSTTKQ